MRTIRLAFLLAAAVATTLHGAAAPQSGTDSTVENTLRRAVDYVREYRDKLTYVMATERSKQLLNAGYIIGGSRELETVGDVYFVYLPADKIWMAVRDVEQADGKTVPSFGNARELLNSGKIGAARQLKDRNAYFNLGSIVRNFNEPTLALTILEDQNRPRFTFSRIKSGSGKITLAFVEIKTPSLILNTDGKPAMSRGELVIDSNTGRVEESHLAIRLGNVDAELSTSYEYNSKLDMMVPVKFDEQYQQQTRGKTNEKVKVESTYSDFSRFDVAVRIR